MTRPLALFFLSAFLSSLGLSTVLAQEPDEDRLHELLNTKTVWPILRSEIAIEFLPENHPVLIKTLRSVVKNKCGKADKEVILRAALALPEGDPVRKQTFRKIEEKRKKDEWQATNLLLQKDERRTSFVDKGNPFL